jgi:ribosomal protein S27AE
MSLETLLKNFGGKKLEPEKPAESDSACDKCKGAFFWRHKKQWFCGDCRKPPTLDFVDEVRGGDFPRPAKQVESPVEAVEELVAVEAYDSVIVAEGDNACPDCPCRWVKEAPRDDGTLQRVCYSCKAVIPDGRHGVNRLHELPFYLLPFWKFFSGKASEKSR